MEIEYRCPVDNKLLFKAAGPIGVAVEITCKGCRQIVTPVAKAGPVFQRTYRCKKCERVQHVDCPADEQSYCIVCGTKTLVIIDEIRPPVALSEAQEANVRS